MPQLAERVHTIQRRPAVKERRSPIAEVQAVRSRAQPGLRKPVSERVTSSASEFVGGLPARLRAGVESLSGIAMDDVRVHRNSSEPAKLGALAFTRGTQIHLGPGQEEHLPHEAWHVVQQKQGRVQATTQMKGAAINDDAVLEREADRMGPRASGAARLQNEIAPRTQPLSAPSVLQAKVKDGETWLDEKQTVSPTLMTFIKKPDKYMLRDDFHAKLTAVPVHLLDMSKKYLLGEAHGAAATAKWTEATKFWSKVSKMFEWFKGLPRSERADVGLPAESDLQKLTLESRHGYLLTNVLRAINDINSIGASWVKGLWKRSEHKGFIAGLFDSAVENLEAADLGLGDYEAFIPAYQKKKNTSPQSLAVYRFAVRFRDYHHGEIAKLRTLLTDAGTAVRTYDATARTEAAVAAGFLSAVNKIAAGHGFLREMARDLIVINKVTDQNELKALEDLIKPTDRGRGVEILNAVNPARERGMADNIKGADAPLLVKLGNDHLAGMKALVGASVVTIDQTESLEKETKKP